MEKDTAKIVMSKALKRWFKALCVEVDTDMSTVVSDLVSRWCMENSRSMSIGKLLEQNPQAIDFAGIADPEAIISGSRKPTKPELVKLSTALGISAEILGEICDRRQNGHHEVKKR